MAIKTIRVFAEYTSDGYVPMPSQGNIDYGITIGNSFPETYPSAFQTDDPNIDVVVNTMTDFYVWIRTHGSSWNPNYTRVVRVYPDSPTINSVVMNMIVAVGQGGTSIGGGSGVSYYLNGGTSQGVLDGSTYYEMSKTPVEGTGVEFFKINTTGFENLAQFVTDAGDPGLLNIPAGNWPLGFYFSCSDNSGNPSFYAEIYKYSQAGVFTLLGSNVGSPEIITNGQAVDFYISNVAMPETTLLVTDRISIKIFVDTNGNRTAILHTQDSTLSTVGTTFTRGITAINGLIKQVQYFAVGNSGSDVSIVSSDDTHTINLPTASATKRGLLSGTDWAIFNAKQTALSGDGFVKISGSTISYDNSSYQPLDGNLTAIGALTGTSGILKKTGANTWELDTTVYLSTTDAATTYQRKDNMASNLLASDTQYPNNNAVLAKLALKANKENPEFTGSMNIVGDESRINFYDAANNIKYFIGYDSGVLRIYQNAGSASRFYINSEGKTFIPGILEVGSLIKTGGTASQFLKADGTVDSNTYATTGSLADYLLSATAADVYQRKDNMAINLLASDTQYPNNNAVLAKLALKADAANPNFTGSMNITGSESRVNFYDENNARKYYIGYDSGFLRIYQDAGSASRFYINTTGKTFIPGILEVGTIIKTSGLATEFLKADGTVDSNTYVSSTALADYLLSATAASTYQRLDKMVSNLLASDTEYPNSNAVIAALALKANAANPTFAGNFTISGAEPKLFFVDTDNNPDYTVFVDSGNFYIYDQTVGATRFVINSSGNATFNKRVTFQSVINDRPQLPGGFVGLDTGDGNFDIWGISTEYYPSHPTAANAWGIRWNGDNNDIQFVGGGVNRAIIDLDNGNITANSFIGSLTGNATGNVTGSAGSVAWSGVTGKPNSLSGYGISDAVTAYYENNINPNTQVGNYTTMTTQSGISGWTHVLSMSWSPSSVTNWVSQIGFAAQNGTGAYYRTTSGGIADIGWTRLLDAANYGSYALPLSGGTLTGNVIASGDTYTTYGPNSTWTSYLRVGGNGRTVTGDTYASMVTTNGNLHLDAGNTRGIYLNYYAGTTGVVFGNGASGIVASMDSAGNLWKGATVGAGTQYVFNSGTWGINITGTAGSAPNGSNINNYYNSTAGEGYGFRFWNGSESYKLSMGVGADYQYGPVSDYSIKLHMGEGANRGITMGRTGSTPTFAHNTTSGNTQVAGTFNASGTVTAGLAQGFLNAHYQAGYNRIWAFATSLGYGMGYYQGGVDYIGFHFGATGSPQITFNQNGTVAATNFIGALTGNASTVSSITNNTSLMVNRFTPSAFIDGLTGSNFRSTLFETSSNGAAIAAARWNNVPTALSGLGMTQYGTMIAWSGASDTHGFLAINYDTPGATVGGGYGNVLNWSKRLAFSDGTGASGSWGISVTGSASQVTHFSGRTDSAYYNVVWAAGNPSHMYSCDQVQIQSSTGTLSASNLRSTFVVDVGNNSGANTGIGIYHSSSYYGRIRFYNDGTNTSTIHAFGSSWVGGASANYINIDGQAGVNFGGWDNPDVSFPRNGVTQFYRTTYAYSSGNTASAAGTGFQSYSPSGSGSGAIMSFHRAGAYAVNFGLDSDNVMRIGGWSAAANRWQLDMSGNQTVAGSSTATSFFESSDIRLKTLIEHNPIVAGIENLEAKLYEKNGKIELGYFAQDAELIMPYAVTKNTDGYLNLSYREVHTAKIARLEQRVSELEKQLNLN